jgi:hypothetical protein
MSLFSIATENLDWSRPRPRNRGLAPNLFYYQYLARPVRINSSDCFAITLSTTSDGWRSIPSISPCSLLYVFEKSYGKSDVRAFNALAVGSA